MELLRALQTLQSCGVDLNYVLRSGGILKEVQDGSMQKSSPLLTQNTIAVEDNRVKLPSVNLTGKVASQLGFTGNVLVSKNKGVGHAVAQPGDNTHDTRPSEALPLNGDIAR